MALDQIPCPRCRKPTVREGNPHRPFCSERCRLVDLEGWFGERYAIPGDPVDPEAREGDPDEPADPRPARRSRS